MLFLSFFWVLALLRFSIAQKVLFIILFSGFLLGYYIFTDIIVGGFYLFVAFVLSMYLAMFIIAWIYLWLDKCCLVYKLGVEGAKNYEKKKLKELQCQNENDKCLSALKSAQYEYWVQWKKFYKSDLSYEEWQEKIINK
ncbi:hypothetical protein [Klebsiella aerogenes]|uniref:hypothetical protein n=1 Tax=Klebsiella aerogenes TaxID=548 RepID=UPI001D0CF719|nr:hypothetical protein [Klebsiella aerogenes]